MTLQESERDEARAAPVFNAPPIVVWLIAALLFIHGAIFVLPSRAAALVDYYGAVSPRAFLSGPAVQGGFFRMLFPLVAHIFIHASWMHVIMNSVWLLVFGAPIACRLGAGSGLPPKPVAIFLAFFILSGVAGAITFIVIHPDADSLLVGASGGISGLLGGVVRFGFRPPWALPPGRQFVPLSDRTVLAWSIVILVLNLATGLFGGQIVRGAASIAWEAHMGGYLFGLLTFPVFAVAARPH
ncbi:MAG TPA: rhomboid family intramembrane serine protease [Parvularculaceae bacterium]|nr:rhomboid family intramembrane serine protease [Parvularculaceae bacterium]